MRKTAAGVSNSLGRDRVLAGANSIENTQEFHFGCGVPWFDFVLLPGESHTCWRGLMSIASHRAGSGHNQAVGDPERGPGAGLV